MIKEKKTEEMESSQVYCADLNCNSKRQQLLSISYNKSNTNISLVCLDCGLLSVLELDKILKIPKLKPLEKRRDLNYLG